jgi:hypothetical protein
MLTSKAREILRSVDTLIVDEIHSLVATKRGAHLMLPFERLRRRAELRSLNRSSGSSGKKGGARRGRRAFRSRRIARLPGSEGRFSLLPVSGTDGPNATERQTTIASQLIARYGVLTREMVAHEGIPGGFAGLYPVLKAMEESGRLRRGYFVSGLGAAQFAAPGAEDRLRQTGRTGQHLLAFLPENEPERTMQRDRLVQALADLAANGPAYLTQIDGADPASFEKQVGGMAYLGIDHGRESGILTKT